MIFIAGISIALFISALLLVKKEKTTSDIFLLLWMLLNVMHLSFHYLSYSDNLFTYPRLLGVQMPFPLLQGVLLYFYVSSVTNQFPKKKWVPFLHLIPALLAYLYLIPFFNRPGIEKIAIFQQQGGEEYATFQVVLLISVILSGIIYVLWCSYLLQKHKKNIRYQFSSIEDINLRWLQFLVYGLGLVWCLVIVAQNDEVIYIGVTIFVILIGFFGVQQKNIFQSNKQNIKVAQTSSPVEKVITKEKYLHSGLSDNLAETQYEKLNELMIKDQFYKNADLSLRDLANELDIHSNYLSQIINDKGGQSFYDYVNTFRINEFKRLLAIPENEQYTLMALAYDCGFNSKSSFNRYFKKITGQTPSAYVKNSKTHS